MKKETGRLERAAAENMGTCWLFCLAASALSSGRAAEEEEEEEKGRGRLEGGRIEYRADMQRKKEVREEQERKQGA